VNTRYLCEIVYTYAEKLLSTFPPAMSNVVFTCTGSESVDLALRIARHSTGAMGILITRNAYHGNTTAAAEISPSSVPTDLLGLHVRTLRSPDIYHEPTDDMIGRFTEDILGAVHDLQQHGIRFAGMIVDTIFSSDGIYAQPTGLLAKAMETVHGAGGLFIADEVQPGFGRTGECMWGFQRHGIVPDIVVLGKPMGNGHPVAGVVVKPEILERFALQAGYFNTFGGNPVSAAAGLAVLEVLEEEGLLANAWETGNYLIAGLRRLGERFACIGDVRGAGLFVGVELCRGEGDRAPAPDRAAYVVNALRRKRVLIGTTGPEANILKIRPPLCFSRENADTLLVALEESLNER
jgi:4-aminobutyrate aminotransferase-like enzyme